MKKVLFFTLILAIAAARSRTKKSYPDGLELFVESVQKNVQDYIRANWEKVDEQFTKLKDSCNRFGEQMTSDEKDKIVKLGSTYVALKLRKTGSDLRKGAKDVSGEVRGTVKDVAKDVKEDTRKAMKRSEKAMEGIKDSLRDQPRPTGFHVSGR